MIDRIVVPTDGSEHAHAAATDAIALAAAHDATVCAIAVADVGPFGGGRLPGEAGSAREVLGERAESFVRRVADRATEAGVEAETAVRTGPPGEEIVSYVEAVDADLVVMGTRGRGGLERLALGSVTDHVVRFGSVRTLVVDADSGGDWSTGE